MALSKQTILDSLRFPGRRRGLKFEPLESRQLLFGDLVISEIVASNAISLLDRDDDTPDWIEIHNPTETRVDLEGWALTDDASDLGKWLFPKVSIEPSGYLIVFASGKDRSSDSFRLTTDFNVTRDGTFLIDIDEGAYDVRLTLGDATRLRDEVQIHIQGEPQETVASEAGEFLIRTYASEVSSESGGKLVIRLEDLGGEVGQAAINALSVMPAIGGEPVRQFDFGPPGGLVEPGYVQVTRDDRFAGGATFGWQPEDVVSHQDRRLERDDVHTNFKLSRDGEYLGLVRPDGTVAFEFAPSFPALRADVSYGGEIQSGSSHFFEQPTPWGPNGTEFFDGLVEPITVSVPGGIYDQPQDVFVASSTPGATIVYTTDGSPPSLTNGTQIPPSDSETPSSVMVNVLETSVVRFSAFKDDWIPSKPVTHSYIFPNDVVNQTFAWTVAAGFPEKWRWPPSFPADYGLDPDVVGPNDKFDGLFAGQLVGSLKAVPTFSIVMEMDDLFGRAGLYNNSQGEGFAWERPTSVEIFMPDGSTGIQVDAGIRIAGDNVRNLSNSRKQSFRLEFRGRYGPTKLEFPLFGNGAIDSYDTIILRGNYNDGWVHTPWGTQYIRDGWARQTQRDMGQIGAHGRWVHVYLNGVYWGIYNAVERPEASFSATYFGGDADEWDALNASNPGAIDGDREAWDELGTMAFGVRTSDQQASNKAYQQLLGNNPDGTDNPNLETLLDVVNYIDYLIMNFYGGNVDWGARNWRATRRKGPDSTGFKYFAWDTEKIIKNGEGSTLNTNVTGSNGGVTRVYGRLRANDEFRLLFADRVHRHFFNGGTLYVNPEHPEWNPEHPEWNLPAARYNKLAHDIELALVAESARWGDTRPRPQPVTGRSPLYTVLDWQMIRDNIFETYFPFRSQVVLDQLRAAGLYPPLAAPSFNQHGGEIPQDFDLVIDAAGTVFYTLDRSDPRQTTFGGGEGGGGPSSTAIQYDGHDGPIPLAENTVVKARTFSDGQWSALNEANFTIEAAPLRISEIMYHPHDPNAGSAFTDDDDFEFIELMNIADTETVELENVAFTRGIAFTFPQISLAPGAHVVVARNQAAFEERYGDGVSVAGQYGGTPPDDSRLNNRGEILRLEDANGNVLHEFSYDDGWYDAADGDGYSLEIIDATRTGVETWGEKESWLPSIRIGGTPGMGPATALVKKGDLNLDDQVNAFDIDDFVFGLENPSGYQSRFGVPASLAGDMDDDGDLDFDDILGFVDLLAVGFRQQAVLEAGPVVPVLLYGDTDGDGDVDFDDIRHRKRVDPVRARLVDLLLSHPTRSLRVHPGVLDRSALFMWI